jgi:hypothetical protein
MFDKIKILTFAKGNFIESQNKLKKHLDSIGIKNQKHLTDSDLPENFKKEFENYFLEKRGYGYWIWKPFIILNELKNISNDEILLYIDSTDLPKSPFFDLILNHFKTENIFLTNRGYKHGDWTKRDCFIHMNCDNEKYYNEFQLEAGLLAFKKNDLCFSILNEWFENMKNKKILDDTPNTLGFPNLPNFRDHRHDQSILTNLSIQKNIKSTNISGDYVIFNYNQPKKYS